MIEFLWVLSAILAGSALLGLFGFFIDYEWTDCLKVGALAFVFFSTMAFMTFALMKATT